ncbi:dihydroxyacetone kinase subunit DhaK (plasmid) [Lichenicola cladoniae]|uniref:Dihydroxyacetone kinase subunit DhaK n=1 Tax=Lichenicola cladoniae TaxID=1484109 RepID=A0A6M8I1P2_9PROT|nr:dihydroxyacetone kinase subunit DhaK [Lichenicola cladoniae]NPD69304.1 dihydroxyacetone kinase subunit DhaK [Acetobacteraceae bacterium]QKE93891.1 dihydroxyacetone kinase subunit DhaK [Lichenicola cladoniae]
MLKKAINDPEDIVDEVIQGIVFASHGRVRSEPKSRVILRMELDEGRPMLLIGGGSGHEPMYAQFVGPGYADAVAVGNVFAAPTPNTILAGMRAIDRGQGVLLAYANFAGDNMNFDVAAEMAEDLGIRTMTVRAMDDIALPVSAGRRGMAGIFFLVKIAGAACASGRDLDAACAITTRARNETRSLSVAFRPGSLPETGEPTFSIADDEIEIGAGGHGERGIETRKVMPADKLVELMLERLIDDFALSRGHRVALLVNDSGATTMMELLIVNRRVHEVLEGIGVTVVDTWIGPYVTTQEMAGFSIAMLRLDDEIEHLLAVACKNETFLRP